MKLCQVALLLFGKLSPEYADGLLCDVTEQAINDWWAEIGTELFNVDPSDGILGPTTVAALLGTLMGARNRLHAYGAPVAKDVFDIASTKRGIAYFQKSQKFPRTRRFDRQTLDRLHRLTAKAASGEGWAVPRAVKSTVAELSGKGGEMVKGALGRDKAGIAEVETLDIETFIQLLSGERSKWLWYGKPRKHNENDVFSNLGGDEGKLFSSDDQGGYVWSSQKRDSVIDEQSRHGVPDRIYHQFSHGSSIHNDSSEKDPRLRKTVLKNVTGRMTDARGRFKEAVGFRGHGSKPSKDDYNPRGNDFLKKTSIESVREADSSASASQLDLLPTASMAEFGDDTASSRRGSQAEPGIEYKGMPVRPHQDRGGISQSQSSASLISIADPTKSEEKESSGAEVARSASESVEEFTRGKLRATGLWRKNYVDVEGDRDEDSHHTVALPKQIRGSQSLSNLSDLKPKPPNTDSFPRHLSFSSVVDVVAARLEDDWIQSPQGENLTPEATDIQEDALTLHSRIMGRRLQRLNNLGAIWVEQMVKNVENFDTQAGRDWERIEDVCHQKLEEYHALHEGSNELLDEERTSINEAVKDLEVLGAKLEYELSALQSKVEDVESAVDEFERQVVQLEMRAEELDEERSSSGWLWCWLRPIFGQSKE